MLRPFSSVSRGHSFVLCGLHDLFSLFPIIPLRFAEPSFRILLCFLSILSCFFFAFSLVLCVFTLSSHFVHSLFIINCYTIFKLREQPLNNENAFTTHIDKFFHNSLGVPGTSGHSSFYGKHFPGCTAFSVKKNVPMAHSRALIFRRFTLSFYTRLFFFFFANGRNTVTLPMKHTSCTSITPTVIPMLSIATSRFDGPRPATKDW